MTSFISIKCGDVTVDVAPYNEQQLFVAATSTATSPHLMLMNDVIVTSS